MKLTYKKSWGGNLLMLLDLNLGPLLHGQTRIAKLKSPSFKVKRGQPNLKVLITRLLLILEVRHVKPTYRKSCAGNLFMWSDLTLEPCFKVKCG